MKKRVFAMGLAATVVFLTACGSGQVQETQEQSAEITTAEAVEEETVTEVETETVDPAEALVEEGLDYFYARDGKEIDNTKAFDLFSQAAELGSAEGYYYLGCAYQTPEYHDIVDADYKKSTEAFEKAYDLGYSLAGVKLGQVYEYGSGVRTDYKKAKVYYEEALAEGFVEANYGLGSLYYDGKGVKEYKKKAKEYFQLAAESEDPSWAVSAYDRLAKIEEYGDSYVNGTVYDYDNEDGRAVNYEKVIEYLTEANELCTWNGDYLALLQSAYAKNDDTENAENYKNQFLAWCEKAESVENVRYLVSACNMYRSRGYADFDEAKAHEYCLKAAELGDANAMNGVGYDYMHGRGVEQNYEAAIEWYEKAAELGESFSMNNIGYVYQFAYEDYETALEWYEKAAELGEPTSMNQIGYVYKKFYEDTKTAKEWHQRAIDLGMTTALVNMAYILLDEGDETGAFSMFQEAADIGDYAGMRALGWCYATGQGVTPDLHIALEWSEKGLQLAERSHDSIEIERLERNIASIREEMAARPAAQSDSNSYETQENITEEYPDPTDEETVEDGVAGNAN